MVDACSISHRRKAAPASGKAGAQSQAQIYGAVPGSDAVPSTGVAHRGGVFAVDQAVYFLSWQTASPGDGRDGGAGVFDASGGGPVGGGQHAKPGVAVG